MGKPKKVKNNPLLHYYPVRYTQSRATFLDQTLKVFTQIFSMDEVVELDSLDSKELIQLYDALEAGIKNSIETSVSSDIIPNFLRTITNPLVLQKSTKLLEIIIDNLMSRELNALKEYSYFSKHGSNIFEFSPQLIDLFSNTDVGDVLLEDIKLPFPGIYLYFGQQLDKKLYLTHNFQDRLLTEQNKHNYVESFLDGAYISKYPGRERINILFTGARNKRSKYLNFIDSYEEMQEVYLESGKTRTTVEEALNSEKNSFFKASKSTKSEFLSQGDIDLKLLKKVSIDTDKTVNKSFEATKEYLKIVINCLLYLQSYPTEVVEDYSKEAPKNLVDQTKRTSASKGIAEKKLNELGYRKIKFVFHQQKFEKLELDTNNQTQVDTTDDKRTMIPHRRRAHLRKQRYGEQRKHWRYVWIQEITVHEDKYSQGKQQYRIYEVSE